MRRTYLVVEGPHDVEVVAKLLQPRGLRRVQRLERLDEYWRILVPGVFPHAGDLLRRVPMPAFFASETLSIAIHAAGGINRIGDEVSASLLRLDVPPDGIGVIVDADEGNALERWRQVGSSLPVPGYGSRPGDIVQGPPRAGVYVMPDNEHPGTLEDILTACGEVAYPKLLASAQAWIEPLDPCDETVFRTDECRGHFSKPRGRAKAVIGAVASVLRPGKAVQVSLQDNLWLSVPGSLEIPRVAALQRFLVDLVS